MSRDPFESLLVGGHGIVPVSEVRSFSMRQEQQRADLVAYSEKNIAVPTVAIADGKDVPIAVGEDGQAMTFERRQQLMKGKPTLLESIAAARAAGLSEDSVNVRNIITEADIGLERLGASAEANRPGYRLVKSTELPTPFDATAMDHLKPDT